MLAGLRHNHDDDGNGYCHVKQLSLGMVPRWLNG